MLDKVGEIQLGKISDISYLDIAGKGKLGDLYKRDGSVKVGDVIDYYLGKGKYLNSDGPQQLAERFGNDTNRKNEFLKNLDNPQYRDWEITNIVSHNQPNEPGFVAYTIVPKDGVAVAAFRGSEPMEKAQYRNDWNNNATTLYEDESLQEKAAREYIQQLAERNGINDLYITGHSLGGHLALYAAFDLPPELLKKLIACDTFNAPGFNRSVLDRYSKQIDDLIKSGRINEFRNRFDMTPSLLYNPTNAIFIDSKDPDASLVAGNHGIGMMATTKDSDGNEVFKRSDVQAPDWKCILVHKLTVGLEALPKELKQGLVEKILSIWSGKIGIGDILLGVAAVIAMVLDPIGFLLDALTLVLAIIAIGVLTEDIIPAIKKGIEFALERGREAFEKAKDYLTGLVDDIVKKGILVGNAIDNFKKKIADAISNFFNSVVNGVKNFIFGIGKGAKDLWNSAVDKGKEIISSAKEQINKQYENFKGGANYLINYTRQTMDRLGHKAVSELQRFGRKVARGMGTYMSGRLSVDLIKLVDLQNKMRNLERNFGERINQIQNEAKRITSGVSRSYSEYYVQQQINAVNRTCDQLRESGRRVCDALQRKASSLQYALAHYKEIENLLCSFTHSTPLAAGVGGIAIGSAGVVQSRNYLAKGGTPNNSNSVEEKFDPALKLKHEANDAGETWCTDALNRGWGPVSHEEYCRRVAGISVNAIHGTSKDDIYGKASQVTSAITFTGNAAGAIAVNANDFTSVSKAGKVGNAIVDIILPTTTETTDAQRLLNKAASLGGQGVKLASGELLGINTIKAVSAIGKVGKVTGVAGTVITPFTEIGNSTNLFKDDLALVAQYDPDNYNKALAFATVASVGDACSFGFARSLANTVPSLVQVLPGEDPQWTEDWIGTVNRNVNIRKIMGK